LVTPWIILSEPVAKAVEGCETDAAVRASTEQ